MLVIKFAHASSTPLFRSLRRPLFTVSFTVMSSGHLPRCKGNMLGRCQSRDCMRNKKRSLSNFVCCVACYVNASTVLLVLTILRRSLTTNYLRNVVRRIYVRPIIGQRSKRLLSKLAGHCDFCTILHLTL